MATIDASKIPVAALKALEAGERVKLVRSGKTISMLRATPARAAVSAAQARRILDQIRESDTEDDWSDYIDGALFK